MLIQIFLLGSLIGSSLGDGKCPEVPPEQSGICVEMCSDDDSCGDDELCCSNGCGHVCMEPVEMEDIDEDNEDEECQGGQVKTECGSPCTKTCEDPDPVCAEVCVNKCECPADRPIWNYGVCVTDVVCLVNKTCQNSLDLVYKECGRACTPTCDEPLPKCTQQCVQRCECYGNDRWHNDRCIPWQLCPNEERQCFKGEPLAGAYCGRGGEPCPDTHYCAIHPADEYAVCCLKPTGMCPMPTDDDMCETNCTTDSQCSEGQKCCEASCGKTCRFPLPDDDDEDSDEVDDGDMPGGVCNLRRLSYEAKEVVQSVISGDRKPSDLVEFLHEIVRTGCVDRITRAFEAGTCAVGDFMNASCEIHHIAVLKGFLGCLSEADKCLALTQIFGSNGAACIEDDDLSLVAELFVSAGCPMPVEAVLLLPLGLMQKYVKNLLADERVSFAEALHERPQLFQLLSCTKKRKIIEMVADAGLVMAYPHFIPYLPNAACEQIINATLRELTSNLDTLKEINFECAESDNMYSMLRTQLHQHDMDLTGFLLAMEQGENPMTMPSIGDIDISALCPAAITCGGRLTEAFSSLSMTQEEGQMNLGQICSVVKHGLEMFLDCMEVMADCDLDMTVLQPITEWLNNTCYLTFEHRIFLLLYRLNQADTRCKFDCGRMLAVEAVDALSEAGTDIDVSNAEEVLGQLSLCLDVKQLIANVGIGGCGSLDIDTITQLEPKERRALAVNCLELNPEHNYTDEVLAALNCLLLDLRPSELRNLPDNQLCRLLSSQLQHCLGANYSANIPTSIIEYVRRSCSNIPAIIERIVQRGIQERRADTAEQNREDAEMERKKGNKAKARALNFLATKKTSATDILSVEELATLVPAGVLKKMIQESDVEISELDLSGATKSQRKALLEVYKNKENKELDEFTEDDLEVLKAVSRGLNHLDLAMICEEQPLACISLFERLTDGDVPLEGKIVRKITELWRKALRIVRASLDEGMTAEDVLVGEYMQQITPAEVERLSAEALRYITPEELQAAAQEVLEAILRNIASDSMRPCGLSDQHRMQIAEIAKEHFGDDEGSEQTEGDVDIAPLLADAEELAVSEGFLNNGGPVQMALCPFCLRPGVANQIISRLQDLESVDHEKLGCWMTTLLTDDISEEQRNMILDTISANADDIKEAMMCSEDPQVKCRLRNLGDEVKERVEELREKVSTALEIAAMKMQDDIEEDMGEARRKRAVANRSRRQATMYLCQTLQAMDDSSVLKALTTENTEAMDNDEFLDCIDTLGDVTGWSGDQATVLLTKALEVLDIPVCELTDGTLSDLGNLALGLTVDNISCLEMDLDMVTTLGQLTMWSNEQLMALMSRYLENSGMDASDLTADVLVSLGHVLCGLGADQIADILPTEYRDASSAIGALETAPLVCLRALVAVATHVDAYGPMSGWTSVTYTDIGILLGGLTGEQLMSADEDDYTGFQSNGLKHIPAEELNKLSATEFASLSRAQLVQLTEEQRNSLSDQLKEDIDCLVDECEDEGDDDEDGPITGVAGLTVSVVSLISAYLLTMLM